MISTWKICHIGWYKLRRVKAGSSKSDFKNKVRIVFKEARESNCWLQIIKALGEIEDNELEHLLQENKEIKTILAAIINNTK